MFDRFARNAAEVTALVAGGAAPQDRAVRALVEELYREALLVVPAVVFDDADVRLAELVRDTAHAYHQHDHRGDVGATHEAMEVVRDLLEMALENDGPSLADGLVWAVRYTRHVFLKAVASAMAHAAPLAKGTALRLHVERRRDNVAGELGKLEELLRPHTTAKLAALPPVVRVIE